MKNIQTGIEFVRKKPHLFLPDGAFNIRSICGRMVSQAFMLGCSHVEIVNSGSWWVLNSDFDWITNNPSFSDPSDPFEQIISDVRLGQNSCYGEVVLAAFCHSIVVYKNGRILFQSGTKITLPNNIKKRTEQNFSIFFLYEE